MRRPPAADFLSFVLAVNREKEKSRRGCGNVGIRRCLRDFQGVGGSVGNRGLVFHAFHSSAISTAIFSSGQEHFGGTGDSDLQRRSRIALARPIFFADSVSLIVCANWSSEARLTPGLRYFDAPGRDFSFPQGVA